MHKRKRYYHKTIVVKDIFKSTFSFVTAAVFAVGLFAVSISRLSITPSNSFILSKIDNIFAREIKSVTHGGVYDHILRAIPSIKSSEEMTKKYFAKYGGVKMKEEKEQKESYINNNIKTLDMSADGISFRNETAYVPNADELLNTALSFGKNPTVLIVHTHASEGYIESEGARSKDNSKNVVRVGEVLAEELLKNGVSVVHDKTHNDEPSYNGSYNKALLVIEKNISQNKNIEIVLDVHRDYAEQTKDGKTVQLAPKTKIGEEDVAQIMFVVGTDANGLKHPLWHHNLSFAAHVQSELIKEYPKLMRPINLRRERFNQHKTKGSLIVEMGTAGNTLAENERAARFLARAIAKVLKS